MWEVSDWSSYSVYTQKSFPDCSLYFCIMLCKVIDTAQFFWQIDFEFFDSNYVSFLFYRLTGSQTRTPAPQICAPWSAKSRRTAQHTVLACKRVSQNYAYVWNYLNSKKKKFFFWWWRSGCDCCFEFPQLLYIAKVWGLCVLFHFWVRKDYLTNHFNTRFLNLLIDRWLIGWLFLFPVFHVELPHLSEPEWSS